MAGLRSEIARSGFACSVVPHGDDLEEEIIAYRPDLVLVETKDKLASARTGELIGEFKQRKPLPVVALLSQDMLDSLDDSLDIDDFITSPYDGRELVLRIKRLLNIARNGASGETIECDGLLIDLARCEVTLEGRIVELTFKEYELLKLLAANSGRVYSREALLDQVWGYDYYGGDRTVDVHVRRLRSKIEDPTHTFIETVRNVGYRFRKSL